MTRVDITAGSRLHFGLLCGPPDAPWHYGGLGLMLRNPAWEITVQVNHDLTEDVVTTSEEIKARITKLLSDFREIHPQLPALQISARNAVDQHSGLGSGTQLSLSLGAAFLLLSDEGRPGSIETLAAQLGRSQRSAVGTFGFDNGGFIIDEGRSTNNIERIAFPDEWRMVLLTPTSSRGLHGTTEEAFFGKRDFLSTATIQEFDQLIHHEIRPALLERDLPAFRNSLATYGELVGQYYSAAQGGVFSNETVRHVASELKGRGTSGAVQSSWGPTVCIPAADTVEADQIRKTVFDIVTTKQMNVTISAPLNTGVTIRTPAPNGDGHRSFG